MNYKARRGSLALAKRLISNEVVRDDKWNKKFTIFVYILNGVNRGALLLEDDATSNEMARIWFNVRDLQKEITKSL